MALDVQISTEELRLLLEAGYLATERREWTKAKEIFEGVQALGRGADVAEVGLANLYLSQGNAKDAEKTLRQAVKTNASNAFAYAQLGELLHTVGKNDEALEMLKKAKELDKGAIAAFAANVEDLVKQGVDWSYKDPTKPAKSGSAPAAKGKK